MDKNNNFIFMLIFILGFFFIWDKFVMSKYAPLHRAAAAGEAVEPSTATAAEMDAAVRGATAVHAGPTETDKLVPLNTDDAEVVFLSGGARVASWKVKEKDHWLELVMPEKLRDTFPLDTFPDLNFTADRRSDREVVFTAQHPSGFTLTKTIKLLAQPPFHSVSIAITNTSGKDLSIDVPLLWGNGLDKHPVNETYEHDRTAGESSALDFAGRVRRWRPGLIFSRQIDRTDTGAFEWVGVDNHHFLAAIVAPTGTTLSKIVVRASRAHPPVAGPVIEANLKPGETMKRDFLLYVGPKSGKMLRAADHNLIQSVDYGFFGVITKGLLKALGFFHAVTGNWGWAIILLTLSIQICLFPLTKKSLAHSVKMRELQPHLKKLQEQYKDDPKRYQVEMMNFYRKNGMKFMGLEGCLPMLVQLPIFYAFYAALNNAYELRGAPWIFWIKDLGTKDPYHALPILMGIGMFAQQKLSATAMDPAQARMMMIMPLMFTFMFFSMPSGLILYWCMNSLVTICIQQILSAQRRHQPPVAPA